MGLFSRRKSDEELRDEKRMLEEKIREEQSKFRQRADRKKLIDDVNTRKSALQKVKSAGQPQSFGGFLMEGVGKVGKVVEGAAKTYGETQKKGKSRSAPQQPRFNDPFAGGFGNPGSMSPYGDPFAPKKRRK